MKTDIQDLHMNFKRSLGNINEYYFRYNSLLFNRGWRRVSSDSRQYFNEKGEPIRNLIDVGEGNKNSSSKAYLSNLQSLKDVNVTPKKGTNRNLKRINKNEKHMTVLIVGLLLIEHSN